MVRTLLTLIIGGMVIMAGGCNQQNDEKKESPSALTSKIARFVTVDIAADTSRLSAGDRAAMQKLIDAAKVMDSLYLTQEWSGNLALLEKLRADTTQEGRERLRFFLMNMGPWSELDHDSAFLPGIPERPAGANYYPPDMTKEEFSTWLASLPEAEQKQATGFFTVIRRGPDGKLTIVPYSQEYRPLLEKAAQLLREAATLTDNAGLKRFLTLRADAFLSNDYYDSDVAWMDLDSPVEPTIGPYEVYMDRLFNYKAAFEAFITLRDDQETARLADFSRHLQEIENNLPIEPHFRNPKLGALSPIRVVDEVVTGGEARGGVQTAAFNLPNDERITAEKGSKRVMLRNVQQAKFESILVPISQTLIDPEQQPRISFQPFFTHILAHELMHGLGPHNIRVDGKKTTVRQAMRALSSAFEEAKADVAGLFALQFLMDRGAVDTAMEQQMYVTFLAGVFRSVRFGINEAHGKGMALQFNYLTDEGAFEYNAATGRYKVNFTKIREAVRKLTGDIMTIQAKGDYSAAKAMLDRYGVIRPEMQQSLDKLTGIPVDIEPRFTLGKQ